MLDGDWSSDVCSSDLARNDRGAVTLAFRSGIIAGPLPAVPGSSLPYVGPIAVAGGLLPVAMLAANPKDVAGALAGTIGGAALFYTGFALEDVRQFCWRQRYISSACFKARGCVVAPQGRFGSLATWLLAGTGALAALAITMFAIDAMTRRYGYYSYFGDDYVWRHCTTMLYSVLAIAGATASLWLLGWSWDGAVAWWNASVKRPGIPSISGMWWFCAVPWLWVVCGVGWIVMMCCIHGGPGRGWEGAGVFSMFGAGGLFAAWLGAFLWRVHCWRTAQELFWSAQRTTGDGSPDGRATTWWHVALTWGAVALAVVQACIFGLWFLSEVLRFGGRGRLEEVMGLPLLIVLMHYPVMWVAMLLREVLLVERLYARLLPPGEDAA
jgi:hypothetical protein